MLKSTNFYQGESIGKVRTGQEDSHRIELLTPNGMLFVVCDGMGGHVGGKKASSIATESIVSFASKQRIEDPYELLKGALQFANTQICGYSETHPEFKGMGTTACVLLLRDGDAYIAHVGDSRIYLYLGKEKKLHRLTKDHSYVQVLVDKGEISDEEAERHPQKNRILKALGVKNEVEPSFNFQKRPIKPKDGDIFLICSDGLSGMVPDSQMEEILSQKSSIQEIGDCLIQSALDAGGYDNVTVELVLISGSPYRRTDFKSYNPERAIDVSYANSLKKVIVIMILIAAFLSVAWLSYRFYGQYSIRKERERVQIDLDMCKNKLKRFLSDKTRIESNIKENKRRLEKVSEPVIGLCESSSELVESYRKMEIEYERELSSVKDSISNCQSQISELESRMLGFGEVE